MLEVWMHKMTGNLAIVSINWIPTTKETLRFDKAIDGITIAYGTFHQDGWLFQNQNNVYFVVGMQASDSFENLGLLEELK